MASAWKTFDERTATALKYLVVEGSVSVEGITGPLFADGDSVVIAPTLQKGAALVITARRKASSVTVEEPAQFSPLIEEIAAPEASTTAFVALTPEPVVTPEQTVADPRPTDSPRHESEVTFGPTTWERADEVELPTNFASLERDTLSTDPEIWDLPSQAPSISATEQVTSKQTPVAANSGWEEERYVATGFLGLEDYVEDEQEILRAKRPWWKRIFSD